QSHNIVRHPDMPRAAYLQMWQRLQQGKSWLGAVKNRCKNGDYYWVRAYVIPILDNAGNILELQSIRARLETPARQRAERLYAGLSKNQPGHGPFGAAPGVAIIAAAGVAGALCAGHRCSAT